VSVLRFGDRITQRRDSFDLGGMQCDRLPLLGWVLRAARRMVN
jgi:hypothetical protein